MDKRDFIKTSVAAITVGGASGANSRGAVAGNFSVHELDKLKLKKQAGGRMFIGNELVMLATATATNRLWFVADPNGFAAAHHIEVPKGFLEVLQPHIAELDDKYARDMNAVGLYEARLLAGGPKSGDGGSTALPLVMAAAAVVAAAAAVVSAVAITYMAFKWNIEVDAS